MTAKTKKKKKTVRKIKRVKKARITRAKPDILGKVTHYFDKINVAVVKLSSTLKVGDYVEFVGRNGKFSQIVDSIQINHKQIPQAGRGAEVGLKVAAKVNEGYAMKKAEQPSLLNTIPTPKPSPMPTPSVSKPKPTSGKEGYGGVKFLKF